MIPREYPFQEYCLRTHSALLCARLGILEGYVAASNRAELRTIRLSDFDQVHTHTHAHARTHARLFTRTCTHVRVHARGRAHTLSLRSSYPFFGVACAAQALQLWRLRIALPFALANWRNWLSVSCALIEHAQVGVCALGRACARARVRARAHRALPGVCAPVRVGRVRVCACVCACGCDLGVQALITFA